MYETGTAITSSGALTAYSGKKTGRSPQDKRIVKEPTSEKDIWWGPVNKPMSPEVSFIHSSLDVCQIRFHSSGLVVLPLSADSRRLRRQQIGNQRMNCPRIRKRDKLGETAFQDNWSK